MRARPVLRTGCSKEDAKLMVSTALPCCKSSSCTGIKSSGSAGTSVGGPSIDLLSRAAFCWRRDEVGTGSGAERTPLSGPRRTISTAQPRINNSKYRSHRLCRSRELLLTSVVLLSWVCLSAFERAARTTSSAQQCHYISEYMLPGL